MITKVNIKIESIIDNLDSAGLPDGESEKTTSYVEGIYRCSGDEYRITYKEKNDGAVSESEIICIGGGVTVGRRGAIVSELYFKEGETHSSIYSIPPYKFDAELTARRVNVELGESGGRINLVYNMKIGGAEKTAIMRIWISKATNQA